MNIKSFLLRIWCCKVLVGCSADNHHMDHATIGIAPCISRNVRPSMARVSNSAHSSTEALFAVVLLHGLDMDSNEMDYLAMHLAQRYREKILIINSETRTNRTVADSATKQSKKVYEEIAARLTKYNKQIYSFPLFIIGQSQGGVVATLMAQQYADKLNLLGFITHHSPLKGADLLTRGPLDILKFQTSAAQGLSILGVEPTYKLLAYAGAMKYGKHICTLLEAFGYKKYAGLRELWPNSACMAKISHYLRSNDQSNATPGLLIAGYQNDYGKLFRHTIAQYRAEHNVQENINDDVSQAITTLNRAHASLLTQDEHALHDHLIPLKSQLCRGDSLEDFSHIDDEPSAMAMPNNPNITCVIIPNVTHCTHLFPVADLAIEQPHETMVAPIRMLPVLYNFIEKHLNRKIEGYKTNIQNRGDGR